MTTVNTHDQPQAGKTQPVVSAAHIAEMEHAAEVFAERFGRALLGRMILERPTIVLDNQKLFDCGLKLGFIQATKVMCQIAIEASG